MDKMEFNTIHSEKERRKALTLFRKLSAKKIKTKKDHVRMKNLALLIENYERKKYPVKKINQA